MSTPTLSRKQAVIARLYAQCKERGNFVFKNSDVSKVAAEIGFGNPFDATKWDNSAALPDELKADDVFVVHLGRDSKGKGQHKFVSGISIGYHQFEPIPNDRIYQWPYRRSVLNNINTSESNILSVGYNHRIIHDFLYEDIAASPKVYGSNRTQIALKYRIRDQNIKAHRLQVEIDFTAEYLGYVTIFEAKNGEPADFNVFQIFNPFRYYVDIGTSKDIPVKSVNCCYLLRHEDRLRLYLYSFREKNKPSSIELLRSSEYKLVRR